MPIPTFAGAHINGVMADGNDRPSMAATGNYPQMVLMAGGTGNTSHGATVMLGSYDAGTSGSHKHWSIGTAGNGSSFLDIGYHGGTDLNPHAGIRNYDGTTIMTLLNNGNVGIGNTNPGSTLDVAGNIMGGNTAQRWTATRSGYVQSGSWTTIPGLSITFTLTRSATVDVIANGTQRAPTAGSSSQCHEAYRMTVDGTAQGDGSHGERIITSNGLTQWWTVWDYASSVSLAAGSHTISIDTRESAGYSPGCIICGEAGGSLTGYTNCNLIITAVNKYP